MNIHINLIDNRPKKRNNVLVVKGEITINEFKEFLDIALDWWSLNDYRKQWQEGIDHLLDHNVSCFVVSIHNPKIRRYIDWWLLYKIGNKVYVRNQLIISDIYQEQIGDKPFTVQNCYDFIPERGESHDEDGNKISEWVVDWNNE